MADLFRLGQMAGGKAKVHNPTGAAAKAITSRCECFGHSARSQLWRSQSDHTPLKNVDFNWQVKMLNNSCDLRDQIWNPVTLHGIIQCDLHVQIPTWQGRVFLQENSSNQVVVSPTDFKKQFNTKMVIFIRTFFALQTKIQGLPHLVLCNDR